MFGALGKENFVYCLRRQCGAIEEWYPRNFAFLVNTGHFFYEKAVNAETNCLLSSGLEINNGLLAGEIIIVQRSFDEKLKKVYTEAQLRQLHLLIIVVGIDGDRDIMMRGLKVYYPDWYAIPFEDELRLILQYNYGITHVPKLIVVRENGDIVTRKGKFEIENIGINVLVTWPE